jgi:hypothetical protein
MECNLLGRCLRTNIPLRKAIPAVTILLALVGFGRAQTPANNTGASGVPQPASLTLAYGNGKSLSLPINRFQDRDDYQPVVVYTDQALQFRMQFAQQYAGQKIYVGAVEDEGVITSQTVNGALAIGNDGTLSVGYTAPHDPGAYHVRFRFGTKDAVLSLFVHDPKDVNAPSKCQKAN